MSMLWLAVALTSWAVISVVAGLLIGRALAVCSAHTPHPHPDGVGRPMLASVSGRSAPAHRRAS